MELIQYLSENFYTKLELLDGSKITEKQLTEYQDQGVMPLCSYKLKMNISSDSYFGLYQETHELEFYAKGYSSWLGIIQSLKTTEEIYTVFHNRYASAIDFLNKSGHSSSNLKVNSGINAHIKEEWEHFLAGIYGLCTKSGLPEDIAAKELAILEISELSDLEDLSDAEITHLTKAVDLLDSSSSQFAPHERLKSSRHRLINEVRRKFKLQSVKLRSRWSPDT